MLSTEESALSITVGMSLPRDIDGREAIQASLRAIADAGVDRVVLPDHISFHEGHGSDGLIAAMACLMLEPRLPVFLGVYLLPLRHPVLVARQLATLSQFAPGRLTLGVGVGGEDRHEVLVSGVDPSTRGRRMDEAMQVVRGLMGGEAFSFRGEFFDLDAARILPPPSEPIPLIVGGRSDAAVRRAGRLGDGWLGIWNSPRRFAAATALAEDEAAAAGRADVRWRHGMQVWCSYGRSKVDARARITAAMEQTYKLPFASFERYCPYGTAEDIAAYLEDYVAVGCRAFNLTLVAEDAATAAAGAAEVKRLLAH
jgi:alkanesulfonate monooxygenase SsuD/methylene tetrahydromethanopterin reductase-like flavin-dependent oxidoreductase (luciferase family)